MNERTKKRCKKIVFTLLLTFVSIFILVTSVAETTIPEHTKNFYVNDINSNIINGNSSLKLFNL